MDMDIRAITSKVTPKTTQLPTAHPNKHGVIYKDAPYRSSSRPLLCMLHLLEGRFPFERFGFVAHFDHFGFYICGENVVYVPFAEINTFFSIIHRYVTFLSNDFYIVEHAFLSFSI